MNAVRGRFSSEIAKQLQNDLKLGSFMEVPHMIKIVINCGLGEALTNKKVIESMSSQMSQITGQKPVITKAKKAISTFKLREGDPIGLKVTLRGKRMYDFITRLFTLALPRVRDFRGVPLKGFDGRGAYTLGIKEQTIFPDLPYSSVDKVRGFEVTFVTSGRNIDQTKALLVALGMPFVKEVESK